MGQKGKERKVFVLLFHLLSGTLAQGAVGDRVTVRFADGRAMRIALPFTPVRPLPGLALDALKEALDPPVWHALFCRFITTPGERLFFLLKFYYFRTQETCWEPPAALWSCGQSTTLVCYA